MRLLLDTHTFLWFIVGRRIRRSALRPEQLIEDLSNELLPCSALPASGKSAIKVSTGKLTLTEPHDSQLIPNELRV